MFEIKPYWQNYIDGAWIDGGAGRIDVTDPATGKVIAQHALADAIDVDHAVMAARRVHLSGALTDMRPIERGPNGSSDGTVFDGTPRTFGLSAVA